MQRRRDHGALPAVEVERLSRVPTRLDQPRTHADSGDAGSDVPALLAAHRAIARFTVGIRRCTDLHRRFSTLSNSTLHPPNAGHPEVHRPFRAGGRPLCLRHSPASAAPCPLLNSWPAFAGERRSLYRCLLTGNDHAKTTAPCRLSLPRCGLRVLRPDVARDPKRLADRGAVNRSGASWHRTPRSRRQVSCDASRRCSPNNRGSTTV